MTRRRAQVTRQAFENLTKRPPRDCDGLPDRQEEGMNSKEEKWPLGRIGEGGACWTGWAGEREERRERRERTGAKDGPTSHDYFFSFSAVLIHGGASWVAPQGLVGRDHPDQSKQLPSLLLGCKCLASTSRIV